MRTKKLLIIILISLSFTSCDKTIEDRIKKEFKTYVNKNFGEPSDFKEVASIELIDTIGFQKLKYLSIESLKIDADLEQIKDENLEWITNNSSKFKFKYSKEVRDLRKALEDYLDYLQYGFLRYASSHKALKEQIDQNDSSMFIHYEIKARVKVGEDKRVNTYHAYINNNGKIDIKDNTLTTDEMPESWKELTNAIDSFLVEAEIRKRKLIELRKYILKLKDSIGN